MFDLDQVLILLFLHGLALKCLFSKKRKTMKQKMFFSFPPSILEHESKNSKGET